VLLGALAAVALAVVLALVVLDDGDGGEDGARTAAPTRSADPTPTPSGSPTPTPTPTPTEARTTTPAERAAAMEAFVEDYLSTVLVDPASTWRRLTPQFQAASGGYEQYTRWWNSIASADVREIEAAPRERTVTYTVDYVKTDGSSITHTVTLRLQPQGDGFLIADEF
jgi:hypothetical protein